MHVTPPAHKFQRHASQIRFFCLPELLIYSLATRQKRILPAQAQLYFFFAFRQSRVICGSNRAAAAAAARRNSFFFFISFFIRPALARLHAGHNFEFIPWITLVAAGTTHHSASVYAEREM
jgi:hypothetical protein